MNDDFDAALDLALRGLQASDRFEAEVRRRLARYLPEVVDRVVARLRERRILDDARAAADAVDRNEGRRAVGTDRLRAKLERRGAAEELIQRAVSANLPGDAERAGQLLTSKYPDRNPKDRARAARFLYSRGFGDDAIESALATTFGDPTDPTGADVFTE